jgi:hypothetical protein
VTTPDRCQHCGTALRIRLTGSPSLFDILELDTGEIHDAGRCRDYLVAERDRLLRRVDMSYEVEIKRQRVLQALWAVAEASRVLQANVGRSTGPMWTRLDDALAALDGATST